MIKLAFQSLFLLAVLGLLVHGFPGLDRRSEQSGPLFAPGSCVYEDKWRMINGDTMWNNACERIDCNNGTITTSRLGCLDGFTTCRTPEEEWVSDCIKYKCKISTYVSGHFQSIKLETKCSDDFGQCYVMGESLSARYHTAYPHLTNCSCFAASFIRTIQCWTDGQFKSFIN